MIYNIKIAPKSSDYDEPRSESSESVLQVKINSQRRKNSRPHEKVAPSYSQLHDSNQSAQITFQPSNLRSNVINQARSVIFRSGGPQDRAPRDGTVGCPLGRRGQGRRRPAEAYSDHILAYKTLYFRNENSPKLRLKLKMPSIDK